MTSKLLSNSMIMIWLVGCGVANEPSKYVKSDQPDARGDTTAELQQEKVESPGEQAIKPVIAESAPADDKTTEPVPKLQKPMAGSEHEKEIGREEKIRGVVTRALADIPSEKVPPQYSPPKDEEPASTRQQSRRKQLQNVMVGASPPKDSPGDTYIADLNEEVSTTVVIDEETARRPAVAAPTKARSVQPVTKPSSKEDFLEYTVQAGDSLWAIAEYFYGDGFRYRDIFEANRDLIETTNLLQIGQPLRVPKNGAIRRQPTF